MEKRKLIDIIRENGAKTTLEAFIAYASENERDESYSRRAYLRRLRVDLEVALLNYEARYALDSTT